MVTSYKDDFSVEWKSPEDAAQTWMYDPMHLPAPLRPLLADFWNRMFTRYMGSRTITVNGYAYSSAVQPRPPSPEMLERGVADVWMNTYLPRIQELCTRIRTTNYEAMSLSQMGDALDGIMSDAVEAFGYTMKPIIAFMGPTFGFVEFLRTELGDEGPRLGATALQGFENGTAAAGAGLSDLAEEAASRPAVADAIRHGADDIEAVEGGREFMSLLRKYLDAYGWRVESWGVIERPTWAENPRLPLTLIGYYINDPDRSPATSLRRSVDQREEAVREIESQLSADKAGQFRAMLATCQAHVSISEGRALWQLIITGSLRVPFLALGRKLVDAGALRSADDVFFFDVAELRQAATAPGADMQENAKEREADFERWHKLTPPPFVGAPPDMAAAPPELQLMLTLFFGVGLPEVKGREIKGQAASKGVVKARARVLKDSGEADKLQAGEVLVCATTAPPWTPLFAIAAAVVTDSGGVLSHSAICAREYAIPCVVATQVATKMIPDGAMIEVDGGAGIVRLLD